MRIPSFEEFAAATDADELNEVVRQNVLEKLQDADIQMDENSEKVFTAALECSLANTVTLLAAYHEWLSEVLEDEYGFLNSPGPRFRSAFFRLPARRRGKGNGNCPAALRGVKSSKRKGKPSGAGLERLFLKCLKLLHR